MPEESEAGRRLHALRSALARVRNHVELAIEDQLPPGADLLAAVGEAIELLGSVENAFLTAPGGGCGSPHGSAFPGRPPRVLVLEDDDAGAALLVRRLRRCGFAADIAPSPLPEADGSTSLIIDLSAVGSIAPGELALLRRHRPIVLTGAVGAAASARAEELGAFACLTKPAATDQISDAIRRRWAEPP